MGSFGRLMRRSRLFLSAVSSELRSARRSVAATLRTLGFEVVSQDDFPTGHGELTSWLEAQIESCEGLIQLVGDAYGAEPPSPHPTFGRASYTQLELLLAEAKKLKVWVIVLGPACTRDKPPEELDLGETPEWQAERRALQRAWKERLKRDNFLQHAVNGELELENTVLRLRDELGEFQRASLRRERQLTALLVTTLLAVVALGAGGWLTWRASKLESDRVTTAKIRAHLLQSEEAHFNEERAAADAVADWRERERRQAAAQSAHRERLSRIDELAASFMEIETSGEGSKTQEEMTRILATQGVDEAIAYVASRQANILQTAQQRLDKARAQGRRELQPLLKTAELSAGRGDFARSEELLRAILRADPEWLQAEEAWLRLVRNRAKHLFEHATLSECRAELEAALRGLPGGGLSDRLTRRTELRLKLHLGDVDEAEGRLGEAAEVYAASLAIARALSAADPKNPGTQRDLSVALDRLADIARARGNLDEAASGYGERLGIARTLAAADPSNAGPRRDLALTLVRLGDVRRAQGKLDEAQGLQREALTLIRELVKAQPSNSELQRILQLAVEQQADSAFARRALDEAAAGYAESLSLGRSLAAEDRTNAQLQRSLASSLGKSAAVADARGHPEEALRAHRESLGLRRAIAKADPDNQVARAELRGALEAVAELLERRGETAEAGRLREEAGQVASP